MRRIKIKPSKIKVSIVNPEKKTKGKSYKNNKQIEGKNTDIRGN